MYVYIALWPSGKAVDSDSIMRKFESYWGNHAEIAHLVEQLPRKEQVVGSSPTFSTIVI